MRCLKLSLTLNKWSTTSFEGAGNEERKQITWRFPEFDLSFSDPCRKDKKNDRYISYYWTINDQDSW